MPKHQLICFNEASEWVRKYLDVFNIKNILTACPSLSHYRLVKLAVIVGCCNFESVFSCDSDLTTNNCVYVHISVSKNSSIGFSCQSAFLVNQLFSLINFSRQSTFLVNQLFSSINFSHQLTFLVNTLSTFYVFSFIFSLYRDFEDFSSC